jgi:hypothetical protein
MPLSRLSETAWLGIRTRGQLIFRKVISGLPGLRWAVAAGLSTKKSRRRTSLGIGNREPWRLAEFSSDIRLPPEDLSWRLEKAVSMKAPAAAFLRVPTGSRDQ